MAPVNAPRSWPKISLSSSVSGIAAQLMPTNGASRARTELMDGLRDQLLAGARFADDQHGRRRRRRLLDDLVDPPHLRAVADDAAEAALLAQLPAQHLVLALLRVELGDALQQQPQLLRIDRFGQVVLRAEL